MNALHHESQIDPNFPTNVRAEILANRFKNDPAQDPPSDTWKNPPLKPAMPLHHPRIRGPRSAFPRRDAKMHLPDGGLPRIECSTERDGRCAGGWRRWLDMMEKERTMQYWLDMEILRKKVTGGYVIAERGYEEGGRADVWGKGLC